MDNNTENKKMMVKFSELREWMNAGQVEFDVPGLVLTVDVNHTVGHVETDAMEANDRRKSKLEWLHSGLAHLACKAMQGSPQAMGVVAEWAERRYYEKRKEGLLDGLLESLGDDSKEGGAE